MFIMESTRSLDGTAIGVMFMRPDGLFEGRVYRSEDLSTSGVDPAEDSRECYQPCGVAETLARLRSIVYEELGL